jgi:hypothetical protein
MGSLRRLILGNQAAIRSREKEEYSCGFFRCFEHATDRNLQALLVHTDPRINQELESVHI